MLRLGHDRPHHLQGRVDQDLALEADHEFLLKDGVFTQDLIQTYLDYKREVELEALQLRPHPYEFFLYYDV